MTRIYNKSILVLSITLAWVIANPLSAQTWWDKNRGGWKAPDSSNVEDAISEESSPAASESEAPKRGGNRVLKRRNNRKAKPAPEPVAEVQSPEETESEAAYQEESLPPPPIKKKKVKKAARKIASLSEESEEVADVETERRTVVKTKRKRSGAQPTESLLRIGLTGGYSQAAIAQSAGTAAATGSIIYAGGLLDAQYEYIGAEIDVYAGTGASANITSGEAIAIKQNGVLAAVKGQVPLRSGSLRFAPKLGFGYAMMGQQQEQISAGTAASEKSSISGVYGEIGFEFEPITGLIIVADYSRSLAMVKATFESASSGTTGVAADLGGSAFQRIRGSVSYQIAGGFYVGGQVVQRSFIWGFNTPIAENQLQVLGLVGWQW